MNVKEELKAARKFTAEIGVGMVGVNVPIPIPVGCDDLAGFKGSRLVEGAMFGPGQAHFYKKAKTVSERGVTWAATKSAFAFSGQ